jgi:hypothetical protein
MAQIPTYGQWMKDTSSLTSPRSAFLKALDDAIKTYDSNKSPDNKAKVKTALDRWRFEQSRQGKDWRASVRNQKQAVTNLYRAVSDQDKRKFTKEELDALKYIAQAQKLALAKQFAVAEVRFKASTLVGMAQGAGTAWQQFKTGTQSVGQGAKTAKGVYGAGQGVVKGVQQAQRGVSPAMAASAASHANSAMIRTKVADLCRALCPDVDPIQVFSALHLGNVETFAADVAPFVGIISSGGKAVIGWIGVARKA